MKWLILISAFLVILTKLADVLTTLRFLKYGNIAMECNKIARKLMSKFSHKSVVWGVFIISILIVVVVLWQVLASNSYWYKWAFVILSFLISLSQVSVAWYNYTGNANFLVSLISKFSIYR